MASKSPTVFSGKAIYITLPLKNQVRKHRNLLTPTRKQIATLDVLSGPAVAGLRVTLKISGYFDSDHSIRPACQVYVISGELKDLVGGRNLWIGRGRQSCSYGRRISLEGERESREECDMRLEIRSVRPVEGQH